jgi:hypothetical protein
MRGGSISFERRYKAFDGLRRQQTFSALPDVLVAIDRQNSEQFGALSGLQRGRTGANRQFAFPGSPARNNLLVQFGANRRLPQGPSDHFA